MNIALQETLFEFSVMAHKRVGDGDKLSCKF